MSSLAVFSQAQVNAVEFGKNRVQYKKLVWKFHQSPNFNTYTSQGGVELGKFVAQVAEQELGAIENFVEYALQRRANIIVYSNYDDYKSSNIGLGSDWQSAGGLTKLVNNKIVVYFDGNHANDCARSFGNIDERTNEKAKGFRFDFRTNWNGFSNSLWKICNQCQQCNFGKYFGFYQCGFLWFLSDNR
jgi:hypothetical protein